MLRVQREPGSSGTAHEPPKAGGLAPARLDPARLDPAQILLLQRSAGNRAVVARLQRCATCGRSCSDGHRHEELDDHRSRAPRQLWRRPQDGGFQTSERSGGPANAAADTARPRLPFTSSPTALMRKGFDSTVEVCHRELRTRPFKVENGGVRAVLLPVPLNKGIPDCGDFTFYVTLTKELDWWPDDEIGTCEATTGGIRSFSFGNLSAGTYYLTIKRNFHHPYCCLKGDIVVFDERISADSDGCERDKDPTVMDIVHGALDIAGFFPVLGAVPDGVNALIYVVEGDWTNAGISTVAMVPAWGDGAKLVTKGSKEVVEASGKTVIKTGKEELGASLKKVAAEKARKEAVEKAAEKASKEAAEKASTEAAERQADEAIEHARTGAKPAGRAALRAVDAVFKAVIERLRRWVARVFRQGEFRKIWIEFDGDDVVVFGEGSKVRIVSIRIRSVKEYVVEKTEKLLAMTTKRADLLKDARNATSDAAWAMIRKRAIDVSEEVGEHVAKILVKRRFPGAALLYRGSGANVLDLVFRHKGKLIVCEAKGGFARLGYRQVGPTALAQQGTLTYLDATIRKMVLSSDPATRAIARELQAGRKAGTVTYVVTKTGSLNGAGESLAAKLAEIVQ